MAAREPLLGTAQSLTPFGISAIEVNGRHTRNCAVVWVSVTIPAANIGKPGGKFMPTAVLASTAPPFWVGGTVRMLSATRLGLLNIEKNSLTKEACIAGFNAPKRLTEFTNSTNASGRILLFAAIVWETKVSKLFLTSADIWVLPAKIWLGLLQFTDGTVTDGVAGGVVTPLNCATPPDVLLERVDHTLIAGGNSRRVGQPNQRSALWRFIVKLALRAPSLRPAK
jgi:hypothetical protein